MARKNQCLVFYQRTVTGPKYILKTDFRFFSPPKHFSDEQRLGCSPDNFRFRNLKKSILRFSIFLVHLAPFRPFEILTLCFQYQPPTSNRKIALAVANIPILDFNESNCVWSSLGVTRPGTHENVALIMKNVAFQIYVRLEGPKISKSSK